MNRLVLAKSRLVWIGAGLAFAVLVLSFVQSMLLGRAQLGKPLPVYGSVGDFTLTNQDGQTVSPASLHGQVWVADVIFTRCAGPCLKMSRQMKDLQEALPAGSRARLITLTTDPEFDTPAVLKAYSRRFGADNNRWLFLTGTKQQLMNLATDSLKLTAIEKQPADRETPADLFIHSTIFVIVDKQSRLRGVFETSGEGIDPADVKEQLLAAIRRLERES
jgi:cytochrome oxidase Cu insertion factor (SCO1/SenC/PrrC family)